MYIRLKQFIDGEGMSSRNFIVLMDSILTQTEKNWYEISLENISVSIDSRSNIQFNIEEQSRSSPIESESINDKTKLEKITDFMKNVRLENEMYYERNNLPMIPMVYEIETLMKFCLDSTKFINFKFLRLKIKELHRLLKNFVIVCTEGQEDAEDMKTCNFCGEKNLVSIYKLTKCGCFFHINCFENLIINEIDKYFLNRPSATKIECRSQNHLSYDDLKYLFEVKNDLGLNEKTRKLVNFFKINENKIRNCTKSTCNSHSYVDKLTKQPVRICDGSCSYCGKFHGKDCEEFKESIKIPN
jgi:hypothetical protein